MTTKERIETEMEKRRRKAEKGTCESCRHFMRHYTRLKDKYGCGFYRPLYEGHCMEPRIKLRSVDDRCDRYEKREDVR